MYILIVMMGPGETSQGAAFAKHALTAGHSVSLVVLLEENLAILRHLSCSKKIIAEPDELRLEIETGGRETGGHEIGGYDAVVFCNSKTFWGQDRFDEIRPNTTAYLCSLDSNWLFSQPESYPHIQWLDKIFLNFPPQVYRHGLRQHGGNYEISASTMAKIMPIGLIPSYPPLSRESRAKIRRRLGLREPQKLVFCYIGSGITFRKDFRGRLLNIMDELSRVLKDKFRVLYLSNDRPDARWLIPLERPVAADRFFSLLAASDLVFQHQGLGTLEQAIAAQVPVIANVAQHTEGLSSQHYWEVGPFARGGLCQMHFFDDPMEQVLESVKSLLFPSARRDLMLRIQQEQYCAGEARMLAELAEVMRIRDRR